jgi:hypothetical protein
MKAGRLLALVGAAVAFGMSAITPTLAAERGIPVSCSNGHTYYFKPIALTVRDEIVTGQLILTPHRRVKMRLVPMGDGYRYAGRGVWIDGVGPTATLEVWKRAPLSCEIE